MKFQSWNIYTRIVYRELCQKRRRHIPIIVLNQWQKAMNEKQRDSYLTIRWLLPLWLPITSVELHDQIVSSLLLRMLCSCTTHLDIYDTKSGIYFFVLWCWQHCSYFFYWIILLIVYFIISSNFTIIRLIVLMQLTILIDFFLTIVPNGTECFIIFWKNNMLIHCFFKNCKTFCLTCDND